MRFVYTSITAQKDNLSPINPEDFTAVAFIDRPLKVDGWKIQGATKLFSDPRRNARQHKILSHLYLPQAEYSLWIDGAAKVNTPLQPLIDKYLKDADICLFKHPERDCLYDEADKCIDWETDDVGTISNQVYDYRENGYPPKNGLFESGIILRRHTPEIQRFNEFWWAQVCTYSKRDQISLPYALNALGIKYNLFPGTIKYRPQSDPPRLGNPYFEYGAHNG